MPMNQPCDVCCILITQQMHSMPCVVMQLINENQSLIWALAHADVTMHRPSDIPLISLTKTSSLMFSLMYCYVFPFRSFSLSILIFFSPTVYASLENLKSGQKRIEEANVPSGKQISQSRTTAHINCLVLLIQDQVDPGGKSRKYAFVVIKKKAGFILK